MMNIYNVVVSQTSSYKTYTLRNGERFVKGPIPLFFKDTIQFGGLDVYNFGTLEQAENFSKEARKLKKGGKHQLLELAKENNLLEDVWQTHPNMIELPTKSSSVSKIRLVKTKIEEPMKIDEKTLNLFHEDVGLTQIIEDSTVLDVTQSKKPSITVQSVEVVPIEQIRDEMVAGQMKWISRLLAQYEMSKNFDYLDLAFSIRRDIANQIAEDQESLFLNK